MQEMGGGQLEYLLYGRRMKVLILLNTIEYNLCSNYLGFIITSFRIGVTPLKGGG